LRKQDAHPGRSRSSVFVLFWWRAAFEFHLLRCFFSTAGVGLPKFVLGSSDFEAVLFWRRKGGSAPWWLPTPLVPAPAPPFRSTPPSSSGAPPARASLRLRQKQTKSSSQPKSRTTNRSYCRSGRSPIGADSPFSFDSEPTVDGSALSSLLYWMGSVSNDEGPPTDSGSSAKTCCTQSSVLIKKR
jgi:hypothetical protein